MRFISQALYNLEREYQFSIDLYQVTNLGLNLETGKKTITKVKHEIEKCIVLPTMLARQYIETLGSKFDYGGQFDANERLLIINCKYITENVTTDWYCVFNDERYEVKTVEKFEHQKAYLFKIKRVVGGSIDKIVNETIISTFNIRGTLSYVQ